LEIEKMQNAKTYKVAALVGIEFPHGVEIVPTTVDGQRIRFAAIDVDGSIKAWTSPQAPELNDAGKWTGDPLDAALGLPSAAVEFVEHDHTPGGRYEQYAGSLRRIAAGDLI
jgi:hypothetical protein